MDKLEKLANKMQVSKRSLIAFGIGGSLAALGGLIYISKSLLRSRQVHQSLDQLENFSSFSTIELKQFKIVGSNKLGSNQWFNEKDLASLSNFQDAIIINTSLQLDVSFQAQIISGKVDLTFKVLNDVKFLQLDAKFLKINSVNFGETPLKFDLRSYGRHSNTLGDQLQIKLPRQMNKNDQFTLVIDYETFPGNQIEASGINWLEPNQTFGLKHPFLYSQSEPIYARTLVRENKNMLFQYPCQDTPCVKSPFDVKVVVDAPLSAYVSGVLTNQKEENGRKFFSFKQVIPIPAYLFAIVAGHLEFEKLSQRIGIITEPSFMQKCKKEFVDMDQQLSTIESFLTPFEWKEFNLVVLPKSFPFGGMENPNLTFVSPSIVIGDKSCTDVVIHEMVHSWSGNLITCENWECFWLNEGLTMFLEREATRILHGEEIYELDTVIGDRSLRQAIDSYPLNHSYTSLTPQLQHENPDDAFSTVPYEKGFQFFRYLQIKIGREKFQEFILLLIKKYKGSTFNYLNFRNDLTGFIAKENIPEFQIDWDAWVLQPGLPKEKIEFEERVVQKYQAIVELLLKNEEEFKEQQNVDKFNQMTSLEKMFFLDQLLLIEDQLTKNHIEILDQSFEILRNWKNPELLYRFYQLAIKKEYSTALNNHLSEFLQSVGRMKFLKPIYQALTVKNLQLAEQIFKLANKGYHSIANEQIRKILSAAQKQ